MSEWEVIKQAILHVFAAAENVEGLPHAWVVAGLPSFDVGAIIAAEFELVEDGVLVRHPLSNELGEDLTYLEVTGAGSDAIRALIRPNPLLVGPGESVA